jgi:hypothetical protein
MYSWGEGWGERLALRMDEPLRFQPLTLSLSPEYRRFIQQIVVVSNPQDLRSLAAPEYRPLALVTAMDLDQVIAVE